MSPSGGQDLGSCELHAADPSGNRIQGIWECDSEIRQRPDDDPPGFPDEGTLYQGISTKMENRGQVVLQLPDRPRMQRGADSAQPHLRPHLPQHEGHLQRHQRRDPAQFPGPREPAVATAGTMPGGRCACVGVHGPVQLPESRDFGQTPGSDYHEEGCLCVCHDDYYVLRALRLDVVLPERDHGALHDHELHLQCDPEDNRIMEREGIRVVAARRPLGSHIQSPPPPYDSGEEHHCLQQGASRASSPDVDEWVSAMGRQTTKSFHCKEEQGPILTGQGLRTKPPPLILRTLLRRIS
jgi:hypothetical protein